MPLPFYLIIPGSCGIAPLVLVNTSDKGKEDLCLEKLEFVVCPKASFDDDSVLEILEESMRKVIYLPVSF